jgi:hypothetical protein
MNNLAGIRLEGDYHTLQCLYDTVHSVADEDRMNDTQRNNMLALAYDLRHAYDGMRDVIQPPKNNPQLGVRYGVKIIWPMLLIQARQLREGLAWSPHNSTHQACVYDLESVIEAALSEQFPDSAGRIRERLKSLNTRSDKLIEKVDPLSGMFCSWKKNERKNRLNIIIDAFDPEHEARYDIFVTARMDAISPEEIAYWRNREWVDPETGR